MRNHVLLPSSRRSQFACTAIGPNGQQSQRFVRRPLFVRKTPLPDQFENRKESRDDPAAVVVPAEIEEFDVPALAHGPLDDVHLPGHREPLAGDAALLGLGAADRGEERGLARLSGTMR